MDLINIGIFMENNYFIFCDKNKNIGLDKFHVCTWEFKNNTSIIEFGGEIASEEEYDDTVSLSIYIPWLTQNNTHKDLYEQLKQPENLNFVFNDNVIGLDTIDKVDGRNGVICRFDEKDSLCILPIKIDIDAKKHIVNLKLDTRHLKKHQESKTNLYFRFLLEARIDQLSTRKYGINKSSILYDFKINQKRNTPNKEIIDLNQDKLLKINNCFVFNILPNLYELSFFNNSSLKSVRTLEFDAFKKYLGDRRLKADEYIVIFNKQKNEDGYNFFSMYTKERVGMGQLAVAMLINIISGILLTMATSPTVDNYTDVSMNSLQSQYIEPYVVLTIAILTVLYFLWPNIKTIISTIPALIKQRLIG